MVIVLRPHHQFAATYLDDIVMHSSTWDNHLYHLAEFLRSLWKTGLMGSPKKCHLGPKY